MSIAPSSSVLKHKENYFGIRNTSSQCSTTRVVPKQCKMSDVISFPFHTLNLSINENNSALPSRSDLKRLKGLLIVGFGVITVVTINSNIIWDVMPCSVVKVCRRFGGTYCLHLQDRPRMQARRKQSEPYPVNFYTEFKVHEICKQKLIFRQDGTITGASCKK